MMKRWHSGGNVIAKRRNLVVALWMAVGMVPVAGAATFTVNTTVDAVDANSGDGVCLTVDSVCSLRAAVQEANASAGADTITLPAGTYKLLIGLQGEDAAAEGDLDITSEITINGAGADTTIIDGMKSDRVFQVFSSGVATINALTIQNGKATVDGLGGGLSNRGGTVTLNDCNVYRNFASGFGGGLDNNSFGGVGPEGNSMAHMTINRCTISNNIVAGNGGGISNNGGVVIVNDTTIRDNTGGQFADSVQGGGIYNNASDLNIAGSEKARLEVNRSLITGHSVINDGGGIYHLFGDMTITNSTISGNTAKRNGGGIFIANTYTYFSTNKIVHTTITNNRAYAAVTPYAFGGGGLFNGKLTDQNQSDAVVTYLENSIVAANGAGGNCKNLGKLIKQGNFISDDSCINSDEVPSGASYTSTDIGLGVLQDNGGSTFTHALLSGSQAIDVADDTLCESVDQRGYTRPATGCDAGAFEAEGVAPATPIEAPLPAPGSVSTDSQNHPPMVFPMPYTAVAGTPMHGVLNGADVDGDPLTYEIMTQPTHGTIGLDDPMAVDNAIPGSFIYTADVGYSGVDSFTYRACDDKLACSGTATISISVDSGVAVSEIGIKLENPGTTTATTSPITVVTGPTLDVIAPDLDPSFSYPLGAFFFDVKDVPVDSLADGVTVTIQLPNDAVIADNAVIRKLDKTGVWRSLGAGPNPTETTGTINAAAKTITLVLIDNDRFDTNPAVGFITDPVAIAVPKATTVDSSTSTSSGDSTTTSSAVSSSGGGGAVNLLALAGLLLAYRRRLH